MEFFGTKALMIWKNIQSKCKSVTEGAGFDIVLESAGLTSTIEQAFSITKKHGGKCVFASHPEHGKKISIDPFDLICGKQIRGTWGGDVKPDRDISVFWDIHKNSSINLNVLISKILPFSDINLGFSLLQSGCENRVLIKF